MAKLDQRTVIMAGAAFALAGAAVVLFKGRVSGKAPGDIIRATYRFRHRGPGGPFEVGTGVAPVAKSPLGGPAFGYLDIEVWLEEVPGTPNVIKVPPHATDTVVEVKMEYRWPDLGPGKFDALAYLQYVGGPRDPGGNDYIITDGWRDDAIIGR